MIFVRNTWIVGSRQKSIDRFEIVRSLEKMGANYPSDLSHPGSLTNSYIVLSLGASIDVRIH